MLNVPLATIAKRARPSSALQAAFDLQRGTERGTSKCLRNDARAHPKTTKQ
jgi:hypothetical protein